MLLKKMNELDIVKKQGIVTSTMISNILDKPRQNVIKQLNSWETVGEIKIIFCNENTTTNGTRRFYMINEIYEDYFEEEE